jgi:RNA recognition motif-containing protein
VNDRETGKARGFAFIEMTHATERQAATEFLNGFCVNDRAVILNETRPNLWHDPATRLIERTPASWDLSVVVAV